MALTRDEKEKILGLRARAYSYERIARELGYSPTTVRKVVLEAQRQGETRQTALVSAEGPGAALLTEYWQLSEREALEERKQRLRSWVEADLEYLAQAADDVGREGVADDEWGSFRARFQHRLEWLTEKLKSVSTPGEAKVLEGVLEEVEMEMNRSVAQYVERADRICRQRQDQMVATSRRLLAKHLRRFSLFPRSVVRAVKERLLVKDETQAEKVQRAMYEYWTYLPRGVDERSRGKLWRPFLARLKSEGWAYIRELSRSFEQSERESQRRWFGEWLSCVRCLAPVRVAAGSIGWFQCPACGFWIWKGGPGPPALPDTWPR